jgi:DNA-binding transcriptional ArsR family regulator
VADAGELLLHPIRLRIVQALAGTTLTAQQLKDVLGDVAQATLYRHIKQLVDGGMLEVVGERPVRGTVERTYGLVVSAVALSEEDLESATVDDHFRYFATFVGTLLSDFGAYLADSGPQGPQLQADGVGYRQVRLWLSDDELDDMVTSLREVMERHVGNEPSPDRRRRSLTTVIVPDDRPSATDDRPDDRSGDRPDDRPDE